MSLKSFKCAGNLQNNGVISSHPGVWKWDLSEFWIFWFLQCTHQWMFKSLFGKSPTHLDNFNAISYFWFNSNSYVSTRVLCTNITLGLPVLETVSNSPDKRPRNLNLYAQLDYKSFRESGPYSRVAPPRNFVTAVFFTVVTWDVDRDIVSAYC